MKPKISVIVPVYQVAPYIGACLRSILAQDYSALEVIAVDDGSTDNSGEICRAFAAKDARVTVLRQDNAGVCAARNTGLSHAAGDYVMCFDGDDLMPPGAFSSLSELLTEKAPDILLCGVRTFTEDQGPRQDRPFSYDQNAIDSGDYIRVLNTLLGNEDVPWSACRNLIRRPLLEQNALFFDSRYSIAEDCDFYLRVCRCCKSFAVAPVPLLDYRLRTGSASKTVSKKHLISMVEVYSKWYHYFEKQRGNADVQNILRKFANYFYDIIPDCLYLSESDKKELIRLFTKERELLRDVSGRKRKLAAFIYRRFGISLGLKLKKL